MKTKLFLASMLFAALSVRSQSITGGIVGGVSTSAVKIEDTDKQVNTVLQGNDIQGFEAGTFLKLMLDPVYLKPMALYDFSSGKITSSNKEPNSNTTTNFEMHRLEIPVLIGVRTIKPFSIEGGPVYNYIVQSSTDNSDISISQNSGLGYRIGAVLEIKRLLLNASYSGFATKTKGLNSTTFKEPYKIILGLGVKLGKIDD
jgi:hypothetical protein